MARKRHLHPEELDLWHAVASTARPLRASAKALPPAQVARETTPPLPAFRIGEKLPAFRVDDRLTPAVQAAPALRMDAKAFSRMTKGKLAPEARIDLHGMTIAEAHPELIHFILGAHSAGLRLVLVITGKGKAGPDFGPMPGRHGVLRHQVPHWLRLQPLASVVLQLSEAHLRHGGSGAFYVYLRRGR